MRELAASHGGIDQILAEDIAGDNQGYHIAWPGRQQTYAIEASLIVLADAMNSGGAYIAVRPAYHPLAA
jgi:hypothetical protein